jgi:hypothetical protein
MVSAPASSPDSLSRLLNGPALVRGGQRLEREIQVPTRGRSASYGQPNRRATRPCRLCSRFQDHRPARRAHRRPARGSFSPDSGQRWLTLKGQAAVSDFRPGQAGSRKDLSIPYILTGPDRVPNVALTLDPECGRPASRRPGGDHRLRRLSPGPLAQDLEHESAGTAEQGGQAAHRRRRHLPRRRVLLRHASCVLIEAHDEWQVCDRRYLSEASMALLTPPQPAALDTRRPEPNEVIDQPALQTASSATPQSSTRTICTAGHGPAARSQCWLHRQQQAERSWPGSPPRMAPYRRGNAPRAPPAQHRTARSHTEIGGTSQTPPSTTRSRRPGASPAETRPNLGRGTSGRDH